MDYYFGVQNERFGKRGDRRGRPEGTTGARHQDDNALRLMEKISQEEGVTKPYKLARLAGKSGNVPTNNATPASVIRRLAERWKRPRAEK